MTSIMQYPDDIRRLELLRLAGASNLPLQLGLDLATTSSLLNHHVPLQTAGLVPSLSASSLLYPSLSSAALASAALGPTTLPSSLLLNSAVLPLSVTRSLVNSTGGSSALGLPATTAPAPSESLSTSPRGVPTLADYQRYQGDRALPKDFKPCPNSVIIGRKKNCYTSVGNLRLRDIVLMSLPAYSKCVKKKDKTEIVSRIVQMVRESCPEGGAFIKCDMEGNWHEVSEVIARERVASIFRDFLHDQYRSSSKSKVAKRREKRAQEILESAAKREAAEKAESKKAEPEEEKKDVDTTSKEADAETNQTSDTTK